MRSFVPPGHARAVGAVVLLLSTTWVTVPRAQRDDVPGDEQINGRPAAAGRLILKLSDSATASDLDDIDAQADADIDRPIGNGRVRLLHSRSKRAAQLLAELRIRQQIEYVEPDFLLHAADTPPDDPLFPNQWGLSNTAQAVNGTTGTRGADVHAPAAWDVTRGSADTVVGIIDGGVDVTHADLAGNIWSAPRAFTVTVGGMTVSCPAGAHGASFQGAVWCDPTHSGASDHATHVAGIIGATGGNARGVTGLNWSTSLLSLNFMPDGANGYTSDAVNAIEFAIQVKTAFAGSPAGNIRVLNNSWGGSSFSQALSDEIDRAGANDILFVAAAGNGSANIDEAPDFPASLNRPNELSVAASASDDSLAWFSNFSGTSVHLAAPGADIFSTLAGGQFGFLSGTSMASPFVAGAAALVLSSCPMKTADLKALLLNTVDLKPAFAGTTVSGGRLNVEAALRECGGSAVGSGVSLPASWTSADVGATGQAGHASADSGVFTVAGAGSDIWGSRDSFEYVSQSVNGDFTLTARVVSVQNTSSYAKAGLMLRDSLDPSAANVLVDILPGGGVEFMTRAAAGANETFLAGAAQAFPGWLRLSRAGSTVTAGVSSDGSTWTTVGTTSFASTTALAGLAVCSHAAPTLDTAVFDNVTVAAGSPAGGMTLPSPWTSADVGATAQAGHASAAGGVFTVAGAGADIWGANDSFQFVSQPAGGDFTLVARITGEQNTSPYAKAGLMLRRSPAPGAAAVMLDRVPGGGFEFMTRASDGGNMAFLATASLPLPAWVRLSASGGVVSAAVSADGTNWTALGSTPFATSSVLAGLLVCSHSNALDTSTFDNVSISSGASALPPPWLSSDVGDTGVGGSATFAGGSFTVLGAGADIWGAVDGFQFVNQAVSGDVTITARVSSQQNTSPYAKAGIMLRGSLSESSANVLLDMTPGGDFEFMMRGADGASESFLGTAHLPAPAWMRLDRSGSTVTASVSSDGATWTTIGSTSFSPASALAGLVVCSHTTSLGRATFDNVSIAAGEP